MSITARSPYVQRSVVYRENILKLKKKKSTHDYILKPSFFFSYSAIGHPCFSKAISSNPQYHCSNFRFKALR